MIIINKKFIKKYTRLLAAVSICGIFAGYNDYLKNQNSKTLYEVGIKRGLDVICGLMALIVFFPLYVVLAILVKINLGAPILFVQDRPGKDGRIFKLYKFRTMKDESDINGVPLPDDVRLTKFGRLLRKTSLDELPEALNIIKGDMSVVGPRPLLVKYLDRYNEFQNHRHDVRPGLSGYAQVNGRNLLTWQEKFELDVWYTKHVSFLLDLKIIKDTVIQAFIKREGVTSESHATMEEFMGNEDE